MIKITYILAGVAVIIALLATDVIVYYPDMLAGLNVISPAEPYEDTGEQNGTVTALEALSIADKDTRVIKWKAGNANVSIGEISSDFCDGGLSDAWTVTYASDSEEASVYVKERAVRGFEVTKTPERLYPKQSIPADSIIDSTRAFDIAADTVMAAGVNQAGMASAALAFRASGAPIWDLNYPLEGGNYIIRIDGKGGGIVENVTIRR